MKKAKVSASTSLIQDVVAGSRVLAQQGVLDAYGHVSARSDKRPDRFIMSRSRAPALVTAADIMEHDADSEVVGDTRKGFLERYIHGEIYRARPEVMAVVHSHSPSVIPFGVTRSQLKPIYHMASFLWSGVPMFDIRKEREENDLLIRDRACSSLPDQHRDRCRPSGQQEREPEHEGDEPHGVEEPPLHR